MGKIEEVIKHYIENELNEEIKIKIKNEIEKYLVSDEFQYTIRRETDTFISDNVEEIFDEYWDEIKEKVKTEFKNYLEKNHLFSK